MAEPKCIVVNRLEVPTIISLQMDKDEKVEALIAIITDCSAYVAGDITFLELTKSVLSFANIVEGSDDARDSFSFEW